jgi:chromosomal replication initiation ATPase DnaA
MAYTIKKVETRKQRWDRDNLQSTIEEITGLERELWETTRSKDRTIVRVRRMYIYLLKTILDYSDWHIVQLISDSTAQNQISRAMKLMREELASEENTTTKQEIEAIKKNYEARPPYNFDTIA